jgi:hypothetical protein
MIAAVHTPSPFRILALAMLVATTAAAQTPAARKVTPLTAQDYIDIQQLLNRYAFALDTCSNNGYDYADLYTPDGAIGKSYLVYPGVQGISGDGTHNGHVGGYQDVYVKTDKGWRFKRRIHVFPPDSPGRYKFPE